MNDARHQQDPNKVYFQSTEKIPTLVGVNKPDFNLSAIDEAIAQRKQYNENITNFNDSYKTFKPYQNILVRVYLREIKEGKIYTGETSGFDKVQIPSANVQGATWRTVDNPYPFTNKCVVVNVPAHITNIKTGDVLAIPQLQASPARKGDDTVILYDYFFMHPDSNALLPAKDFTSEHFGYAIIPSSIIQGYL
jgi:hypothetical protein